MSFKIIMTTSVPRSCFTKQHQNCKTKTKADFWSQTSLVLRTTVSDRITHFVIVLSSFSFSLLEKNTGKRESDRDRVH